MYFISWLIQRSRHCQFEWVKDYRRLIIEEKFLSIVLTMLVGILCWLLPLAWISIHFIDQRATAELSVLVIILAVPLFYVYHWIMALYEIYREEQRSMWNELKQ